MIKSNRAPKVMRSYLEEQYLEVDGEGVLYWHRVNLNPKRLEATSRFRIGTFDKFSKQNGKVVVADDAVLTLREELGSGTFSPGMGRGFNFFRGDYVELSVWDGLLREAQKFPALLQGYYDPEARVFADDLSDEDYAAYLTFFIGEGLSDGVREWARRHPADSIMPTGHMALVLQNETEVNWRKALGDTEFMANVNVTLRHLGNPHDARSVWNALNSFGPLAGGRTAYGTSTGARVSRNPNMAWGAPLAPAAKSATLDPHLLVAGPNHMPVSGADWYNHFSAKYGAGNVTWESASTRLNEFTLEQAHNFNARGMIHSSGVVEGAMHMNTGFMSVSVSGGEGAVLRSREVLGIPKGLQLEWYQAGLCGMPKSVVGLTEHLGAARYPASPGEIMVTAGGLQPSRVYASGWSFVTPCKNCTWIINNRSFLIPAEIPKNVAIPSGTSIPPFPSPYMKLEVTR